MGSAPPPSPSIFFYCACTVHVQAGTRLYKQDNKEGLPGLTAPCKLVTRWKRGTIGCVVLCCLSASWRLLVQSSRRDEQCSRSRKNPADIDDPGLLGINYDDDRTEGQGSSIINHRRSSPTATSILSYPLIERLLRSAMLLSVYALVALASTALATPTPVRELKQASRDEVS